MFWPVTHLNQLFWKLLGAKICRKKYTYLRPFDKNILQNTSNFSLKCKKTKTKNIKRNKRSRTK